MLSLLITVAALTGSLTVVALIVLRRWAHSLGLVDHPGGRKHHEHVTPVVGGIALGIGLLPLVFFWNQAPTPLLSWGLTALVLLFLGLIDDVIEMSSTQRLLMHVLAGASLIPAGLSLTHLGDLLGRGDVLLGWVAIPLTLFAVATAINAYNMIDGLDGLLALVGLVPLTILLVLSAQAGLIWEATLSAALVAGLVAFAFFNVRFPWVPRASVFMGDAGSTVVGFSIGWLVISVAMKDAMPPVMALYLMMLPLMDTAAVIYRRRVRRVSAATPGRDHLHHILLDMGFNVRMTVLLMAAIALLLAAAGLLMWEMGTSDLVMLSVFFGVTIFYCISTRKSGQRHLRRAAVGTIKPRKNG